MIDENDLVHLVEELRNDLPNELSQANQIMKDIPNAFNAGLDLNDFTPQTLSQLIVRNQK